MEWYVHLRIIYMKVKVYIKIESIVSENKQFFIFLRTRDCSFVRDYLKASQM